MVKYSKRAGATAELRVRIPEALLAHIKDEAYLHKRSLTAEVLHLLMAPKRLIYQQERKRVRERLEDLYGSDSQQVWWYDHPGQTKDERTDDQIENEIEWLPGSLRYG